MDPVLHDFNGNSIKPGKQVACAFSYGSHGTEIRLGVVVGFSTDSSGRQLIHVRWTSSSRGFLPTFQNKEGITKIYEDSKKHVVVS